MKRYFFAFASIICPLLLVFGLAGCRRDAATVSRLLGQELGIAKETVAEALKDGNPKEEQYLFIFDRSGTLRKWGNNTTPLYYLRDLPGQQPLISLANGIYLHYQVQMQGGTIVYLKCLQHSTVQQSNYLHYPNEINAFLSLSPYPGLEAISFEDQQVYVAPLPFNLSDWQVFNPEFYASSSLNPSLGHLIFNLVLLGILLYFIEKFLLSRTPKNRMGALVSAGIVCLSGYYYTKIISSLINDGKLNFDFFNYTELRPVDFFAQLAIILLTYIFIRLYFWFFNRFDEKRYVLEFAGVVLAYNLLAYALGKRDLLEINWFIPLLFLPLVRRFSGWPVFSWSYLLTSLIIVLGLNTTLSKFRHYRQLHEQEAIAEKLSRNDDPVAEFLIEDKLPALEKAYLSDSLGGMDPMLFLDENLFTGYLAKYRSDTTGVASSSKRFSFPFAGLRFTYTSRFNVVGFGFPELLADVDEVAINQKGFSEAIYKDSIIQKSYGIFSYPRSLDGFLKLAAAEDEYAHHIHHNQDQVIVVSYREATWIEQFATVAYLFLMAAIALLIYLLTAKGFKYQFSLKQRIQLTVISIVVIAAGIFAGMTHYYILKEFNAKNKLLLSEKIDSVIIELNHKIAGINDLKNLQPVLDRFLLRLSTVFFTDITLYDTEGTLIATSQPALFEKNILSAKIDPLAFHYLKDKTANIYIQEESIGQLQYLSAYRPFVSEQNKPIAFVNLPYFAKQTELDDQLGVFLVTVINTMIILLAMALAAAIILSEKITEPLKMLKSKVEDIDLLNSSAFIDYKAQDEIGSLVNAYNKKVAELAEKAEELSQNQKELAWREMAKQVAHEIKNPLTPMKLSAQHLKRTLQENDPAMKERITDFINGLIDQINALTKIANEFSNYAQLPKSNNELFDIRETLLTAASLYKENEHVVLNLDLGEEPAQVFADKNLMLSVFNNLMKNSEQAIAASQQQNKIGPGLIAIQLEKREKNVLITISDNGCGIPETIRDSIFMPNFTTKSGGTGLGLAMVKQIITQYNGRIWFETEEDSGTTFFTELELFNDPLA